MYYLSIITITLNDLNGLKNTALSILPLPKYCEWIIVDGNSSDGTHEFLKTLSFQKNLKYISEVDSGIYDAMNKGIKLSKGKYLNFMNSGDCFIRKSLIKILKERCEQNDIYLYNCKVVSNNGNEINTRNFPKNIIEIKQWNCVQHQSTLIRRKIFTKLGLYSSEYKYLSDYDHFIKIFLDESFKFFLNSNIKLSIFLANGVSTNSKTAKTIAKEYKQIQLKYFGNYNKKLYYTNYLKYLISYFPYGERFLFYLRKFLLSKRT
jgi:glycosyltransferase involved in cell wall biosynthesis